MQTTNSSSSSPPHALTQPRVPARSRRGLTRSAALIAISTLVASFAVAAKAPYHAATKPIKDDQGRVQVIIDFTDDAHMQYPGRLPVLPPRAASAAEAATAKPVEFFHTEKTLALVTDFEKRYGFQRTGMTSWVGNSVTARLPSDVIERLRDEKLVKQVSEDEYHRFSAAQTNVMPAGGWGNSSNNNEWTSWGHQAVNGKVYTTQNNLGIGRKIYIIDSGVAYHDDLPPMTRLNVACGSSGNCNAIDPNTYPLVGCYAHATHVAGIIGAIANNSKTIRGAYAGFPNMVSLAVTHRTGGLNCADSSAPIDPSAPSSNVGYALDYIAFDATQNNPSNLVQIATMSMNTGGAAYYNNGAPEPNWYRVKSLSTTIWAYGVPIRPGVFFVQSAGNIDSQNNTIGCQRAYRPDYGVDALSDDGVMVVSASHSNGGSVTAQRQFSLFVSPYGGNTSMWPPSPQLYPPVYSNASNCTDIWAPGNLILSTWGIHTNVLTNNITLANTTYTGSIGTPVTPVHGAYNTAGVLVPLDTTKGWVFLSGTSMAAPFVAAAAAWLADTYGYNTAGSLEQAVRSNYTLDTRPNPGESFPAVPVVRLP